MRIFIYVCVFLCLYSCSESKHISEELNRTEEIINDYPDSVLRSLQAIARQYLQKIDKSALRASLFAGVG